MVGVQGEAGVPLMLENDARTVTDSPASAVSGALAVVSRSTGLITVVPVAELFAGTSSEEAPATKAMAVTDPPAGADDSRWRVALTKQDLRWMTTAEIVEAYHAGAVKLETFVFRTGMPTWVTLLEVPEIAEALAEAGEDVGDLDSVPPQAPSTRPPPRKIAAGSADLSDEPLLEEEEFFRSRVERDLPKFLEASDVIVANRQTAELEGVREKVFTRDIFGVD